MKKHKKLLKIAAIVFVILLGLHFVPIDNQHGYVDRGQSNLCIGYGQETDYTYRIINGGLNGWDDTDTHFTTKSHLPAGSCAELAHLRLYVL